MPRVSIWLPEDLHRAVKEAGLPVSDLAQQALTRELERRRKVALLDAYIAELDSELGPASPEEVAAADAWFAGLPGAGEKPTNVSRSA